MLIPCTNTSLTQSSPVAACSLKQTKRQLKEKRILVSLSNSLSSLPLWVLGASSTAALVSHGLLMLATAQKQNEENTFAI